MDMRILIYLREEYIRGNFICKEPKKQVLGLEFERGSAARPVRVRDRAGGWIMPAKEMGIVLRKQ
jgi:hypothetical protein